MPTDVCLFSNSPDPIVPIFGTSSAKVTEWVSRQSLKRTPHSLDREDRQDFVIRCRTYSNSNSPDSDRGDRRNTSYQQIRYSVYQY
nr:Ycf15 [Dioscorea nipponica]